MNVFTSRRRKSDVVPMISLHPDPKVAAEAASGGKVQGSAQRKLSKMTTMVRPCPVAPTQDAISEEGIAAATPSAPASPPSKKVLGFSRAARSVISLQRQQSQTAERGDNAGDELRGANVPAAEQDPWASVLSKVVSKKVGATDRSQGGTSGEVQKRVSLAHMLKSRQMKNFVKQAAGTNRCNKQAQLPEGQSSVMEHWIKTSMLRNQVDLDDNKDDENDEDDDEDALAGIKSGFDLRELKSKQMYGRTLLLEESCRRAFAQIGENRSQTDLQALKAWFQMTKLKITTDFERLQPAELDLLCRRMTLVSFHPQEIVFRQGDEGDALYLVFSGCVEVRVSQRILGEKVEVTVCELSKGDYFGERSLLSNDLRAATVTAKVTSDLVRISRTDYNIMLKKDQMEFLSRMQMANGLVIPKSAQQSQREYIKVLMKKKNARTKADIDMLSEYLQTLKFFRALPKTFARELCTVVDFLKLPAGSYVFKEGEVGDLFYIIFTGSVDVIVSSKDFRGNAQQTKLINLTEGSHFGELALMKGHGIRSATVMTREECKFLIVCERDYNATLRRIQKEDLSKRVGVLDQIPIFQTPEWTGELLKEMSYVLSEQKLPAGSVLFKQGDKALQVFFIVRGELVMTKAIVDPVTQATQIALVERISRYRVVGDDAAAGTTFNESIFREVTVTASTPVEVLILSKYDVFHRLSRAAREALRTAAHLHSESVVYLDRFHKTEKWDSYKQKVLQEHMNHERLAKILPQTPRQISSQSVERKHRERKREKSNKGSLEGEVTEPHATASTDPNLPPSRGLSAAVEDISEVIAQKSVLVNANEFILLSSRDKAMAKCFSTSRTVGHFVSSFNADAPPSVVRKKQLEDVLVAERRRQVEILNEGNPLAYFDLQRVKHQEKRQHAEARGRAASTRQTLLIGRAATLAGSSTSPLLSLSSLDPPLPLALSAPAAALVDTVATKVMNQLVQENFIFSRPERIEDDENTLSRNEKGNNSPRHSRDGGDTNGCSHGRKASAVVKELAAQHCEDEFLLIRVGLAGETSDELHARTLESPTLQILQSVGSLPQARAIVIQTLLEEAKRQHCVPKGNGPKDSTAPTFYLLPKKKYAVMPRTNLPKSTEETLHKHLWEKCTRSSTLSAAAAMSNTRRPSRSATHNVVSPDRRVSTAPAEASGVFASFQRITLTLSEQREITNAQETAGSSSESPTQSELSLTVPDAPEDSNSSSESDGGGIGPLVERTPSVEAPQHFAVVSMILSKREIANSVCEAPFLCVHELFPSEMEAADSALHMPPQHFKNALLCILPVNQVIHFEDAYDFCVQVEPDRREHRVSSPQSAVLSPNRHKNSTSKPQPFGNATDAPSVLRVAVNRNARNSDNGGAAPEWQVEQEKAKRLHQFICARLGQKGIADSERNNESGFTSKPLLSLEEKLSTLHEYLESSSASVSKGGAALGKYRQMQKFGSIMKARINSTLGSSGLSAALNAMTSNASALDSRRRSPVATATAVAASKGSGFPASP